MSTPDRLDERWGYCPACERWRLSDAWEDGGYPARCPACGSAPDPLERFDGVVGSIELRLVADAAAAGTTC
ncbi:MAG: hypothetical protein ACRDYZ_02085 [Acidimicrobiales bacterium]